MTAAILDGKTIAARVRAEVSADVARFRERAGRPPGLAIVLVGDDQASVGFTRTKERAANEVGIAGELIRLPKTATEGDVIVEVTRLDRDDRVDGILVQLPLPDGVRPDAVIDAIDPSKDVDGLHPVNAGRLISRRAALVGPTPMGCLRLLRETGVTLAGARAVVVGRSALVGRPIADLLVAADATVTIAHSKTRDLAAVVREAEILVAATGNAELVRGDWIREGAVVIDVGLNRRPDGKLVGDVAFEEAKERAAWITPVPGGVGPMTVAALLANVVIAAERRARV